MFKPRIGKRDSGYNHSKKVFFADHERIAQGDDINPAPKR